MKHKALIALALSLCLSTGVVRATDDIRSRLVVDSTWLASQLDDPKLVILHVGDPDDYAKGHIPGARLVTLDDLSVSEHTKNGLMLEMPADDELRTRLQKLGISDDSRIIVYYAKDWVSPATRIVFTMQYAGLGERTSLLDGGMKAWVRQGHSLSKAAASAAPGTLAPLKTEPLIVDAAYVREHVGTPGVSVVDGRAAVYYDGVDTGGAHGQVHKTGHIKGAHSIPFTELANDTLLIRSQDELKAIFDKAGVKPGDTVVGYCHVGQQATATLFAARLLGHPVKLYDKSFQDWSRGADNAVETAAARGRP
ncbi:sulfurtransferase [Tahibacter amnicola]|uniref:Rhodanese-like domain-containing protein n=1 Tax=Tahibacter amnicola TaxID=2976241 RepID=A0ABY6BM99_9GAMM|nr:rhodanese-like domain-containing protein [Tahibacter amnicola]UXI70588.1 rhodanese-like domain-containing protein [Tahibacter amnicola]